ncbi:hypothetical protein DFR29_11345 [Tahibacter aquaticus]|uniref:Uncharacterized protein n=1 Tax=Tahibacter aquaticus TaxID=520092 RepID=A0A4R6YQV2_9GAMM|nr:hypothetical protein [Tahibacter aquaticus]TDR40345.1 hypothetical protein DFR29_11345 [Tahibacter aquaticus]
MRRCMKGWGYVVLAGLVTALPAWSATTVQSAGVEATMETQAHEVLKTVSAPLLVKRRAAEKQILSSAESTALAARLDKEGAGRKVYLLIDRLRVVKDPGAMLRVELFGAGSRGNEVPAAAAAGDFAVYGVSHAEGATAQRSFEVTGSLRKLLGHGPVSLRVVAGEEAAADTQVEIGKISLVLQ